MDTHRGPSFPPQRWGVHETGSTPLGWSLDGLARAASVPPAVTMTSACAGTGATPPPGSPTTLMYGWEHHFSIDWAAAEQGQNTRKVSGYVYNQHGEFATHLRVLAQAIDSGGAVVGQRIAYVPGGVGGFGRAYFEVPNLPVADNYRVSVWDYTWFQSPGSPLP